MLAQLLAANQELLDVLKMHEDLLRTGTEQEERDRQKAEHKVSASLSLRSNKIWLWSVHLATVQILRLLQASASFRWKYRTCSRKAAMMFTRTQHARCTGVRVARERDTFNCCKDMSRNTGKTRAGWQRHSAAVSELVKLCLAHICSRTRSTLTRFV